MEHKNIHEAINGVMKEVGYVQKEKKQGLNYSFASEAALIQALRPVMVEHGIYAYVIEVLKIYRDNYSTKSGTVMTNTLEHGKVRFQHVHSETFIDVEATGEGADAGDKSANKAMTGMLKYALRQTFMIETGDDPDKDASVERAEVTPVKGMETVNKAFPHGSVASVGQELADGAKLTKNDLRKSENTKPIAEAVKKTVKEVVLAVGRMDGDSFSIKEVIDFIKGEK